MAEIEKPRKLYTKLKTWRYEVMEGFGKAKKFLEVFKNQLIEEGSETKQDSGKTKKYFETTWIIT